MLPSLKFEDSRSHGAQHIRVAIGLGEPHKPHEGREVFAEDERLLESQFDVVEKLRSIEAGLENLEQSDGRLLEAIRQ